MERCLTQGVCSPALPGGGCAAAWQLWVCSLHPALGCEGPERGARPREQEGFRLSALEKQTPLLPCCFNMMYSGHFTLQRQLETLLQGI